jgi:hypothetical protein
VKFKCKVHASVRIQYFWAGRLTQAVEHLPNKHEALNSNHQEKKEELITSFVTGSPIQTSLLQRKIASFDCKDKV